MYAEYVGFDYAVALDLHLYHYIIRDMINWGISQGYKWFRSSGLNYDPKLHMRHRLDPLDLYVRHTSTAANAILKLFPNYHDGRREDAPHRQGHPHQGHSPRAPLQHGDDVVQSAHREADDEQN